MRSYRYRLRQKTIAFESLESRQLLTRLIDIDADNDLDWLNDNAWYENVDGLGNFYRHDWPWELDRTQSADFNGDGFADIVAISEGISWFENTDGSWSSPIQHDIPMSSEVEFKRLRIVDIQGDGDHDVIARTETHAHLIINDGQGNLTEADVVPLPDLPRRNSGFYFGDFNNDAQLDLVEFSNQKVTLKRNLGDGSFDTTTLANIVPAIWNVWMLDFDGNGFQDILVEREGIDNDRELELYTNNGEERLSNPVTVFNKVASPITNINPTVDIDADGDLDIISTTEGSRSVWQNDNGTLDLVFRFFPTTGSYAGDINGDGTIDLLGGVQQWIDGATSLPHISQSFIPDILQPGDANRDFYFDESDLIMVAKAGKLGSDQPASWSEGDWDAAPSQVKFHPPTGDQLFDDHDLTKSLETGLYRSGAYSQFADVSRSSRRHLRTRVDQADVIVHFDARSNELSVEGSSMFSALHLHSAAGRFLGEKPDDFAGPFDVFAADSLFRFDPDGFSSDVFSAQLDPDVKWEQLLDDLTIDGVRLDGSDLGNVRLTCTGCFADVDALQAAMREPTNLSEFDVTDDGRIDGADLQHVVDEVLKTSFGDANLDGEFDSADLVDVFQLGEYEDGLPLNSTWEEGDWNGDGEFDLSDLTLAFESGGYLPSNRILSSASDFQFTSTRFETDRFRYALTVDIDQDGDVDLINKRSLEWYENVGGDVPFKKRSFDLVDANSLAFGDLNGDGQLEMVVNKPDRVEWRIGNGQGKFASPQVASFIGNGRNFFPDMEIADIDGDGDNDLVLGGYGMVTWLENTDGKGTFSNISIIELRLDDLSTNFLHPSLGDMDQDGDVDVIVSEFIYGNYLSENLGETFAERVWIPVNADNPMQVKKIVDIDGDSSPDLVIGDEFVTQGWIPNQKGQFGDLVRLPNWTNWVFDFDQDGDEDFVAATNYWLENRGGEYIQHEISTNRDGFVVALADFDNDGDVDMITESRNGVYLLTNVTGETNDGE